MRLNGAPVDERTLRAIAAFILLYVGLWVVGAGVIALDSAIGDVPLGALDTMAHRPRVHSATAAPDSASPGRLRRSLPSATSPRSR